MFYDRTTDRWAIFNEDRAAMPLQAGFHVLKSLAMPSALVEVGFMTNKNDLALLKNKSARKELAAAIVEGIMAWRRDREAIALLGGGVQLVGDAEPRWTNSYRVRRGDNLWDLAKRYGTTVNEISRRNSLDSGEIMVGQTLRLPEGLPEATQEP